MSWEEEIGGLPQILNCQFEEERLARFALFYFLADGAVIVVTVLDRMIEDRRIRSKTRDRQLMNVAFKCTAGQQTAGNVIEPEAVFYFVQFLRGSINFIFSSRTLQCSMGCISNAITFSTLRW